MASAERSLTNMLPFPFLREELVGLDALVNYEAEENLPVERNRELIGDDLAKRRQKKKEKPPYLYVAFGSLFQADHLGVEFALQSHEQLLVQEGLLEEENRLRGHHLLPWGPNYEGLIIDDYFAIGSHPLKLGSSSSFPFSALARARAAYDKHQLEGSVEKDIEAANVFKAAGLRLSPGLKMFDVELFVLEPLSESAWL